MFKYNNDVKYPVGSSVGIWTLVEQGDTAYVGYLWDTAYINKNTSEKVYAVPVTYMEVQ